MLSPHLMKGASQLKGKPSAPNSTERKQKPEMTTLQIESDIVKGWKLLKSPYFGLWTTSRNEGGYHWWFHKLR
jgi:hypothetical protein